MGDMFQDEARGALVPIVPAKQGSAQKMPEVSTGAGSGDGSLQMPAIFARLDGQDEDAKAGGGSLGGTRAEIELLDRSMQYVSEVALRPERKKKPCVKKKPMKKSKGQKSDIKKPVTVQKGCLDKKASPSRAKALCFDSSRWENAR